ncbi:MAG: hydroxymethylglutaryl-CoA reductase, degradative [Candidatus Aenigmatarchaeota archaeon]
MDSKISGFYKLDPKERRRVLKDRAGLTDEDMELLENFGALSEKNADDMIENVVSNYELPLGIATNLKVNGKDYLVPMAVEETSVVAACSYAAKLARENGGVEAETTKPEMIGQIQVNGVDKFEEFRKTIMENEERLIKEANAADETLVKLGGGARDIEVRDIDKEGTAVVHVIVDVRDAMGANAVNTMCETIAPTIEDLTNTKTNLRILSNLSDRRLAEAEVSFGFETLQKEKMGGRQVAEAIVGAYEFAVADPYRAATHNKGVMNGMDAVCTATGNDSRALETGVHAYAAKNGYGPVTKWWIEGEKLRGSIEVPVAVGTVGGITSLHPTAELSLKILDVDSSEELAQVMASVGLLQNFAALRALVTEGIQEGHMKLHAKNIAKQAGAEGKEVDKVAERMAEEDRISQDTAEDILKKIRM